MSGKKRTGIKATVLKKDISNTQVERCYLIAKKLLCQFDLEPQLLDAFSKKQKQALLSLIFEFPGVKAEKENSIPRQYVEKIRTELFQFMKTHFYGRPENRLTYMELAVYGLGFYMSLHIHVHQGRFTGMPQEGTAQRIFDRFAGADIFNEGFIEVLNFVKYKARSFSQVNFRLYGFKYSWAPVAAKVPGIAAPLKMKIELTVQNCESKMFTHKGVERKAFRLIITADGRYEPSWAIIWRRKIFPDTKKDEQLNIFIQSHVLHRFKERVDIFDPADRNYLIQYALTEGRHVVTFDRRILLSCLIEDCPIGYFTFFIEGNDIVINTFIPLASEDTPEGKKLHELLPLGKEDMIYLGMDKVSFYTKVDFEQIPVLKQALVDSNIWPSKLALDDTADEEQLKEGKSPIDLQKTLLVKNYFDKLEQHRTDLLLPVVPENESL